VSLLRDQYVDITIIVSENNSYNNNMIVRGNRSFRAHRNWEGKGLLVGRCGSTN
jgi:hypothetical protein